ncbi:sensor histidine kinase [Lachnospiraceae bacterium LCP25S3_G4]
MNKLKHVSFKQHTKTVDILITGTLLLVATLISYLCYHVLPGNTVNVALAYILALLLIAQMTSGYALGIIASVICVICVNFLFTYPYYSLNFTLSGYPIAFVLMLAISLLTSTTTTHLKRQAMIISEREKLLMEAEKEKIRANLLRAVSHDLRTPLTSIIGSSSTYLENESILKKNEKKDLVKHIYEDSNWLLNMVENLLSVTRINSDSTSVTKSLEPVEEVLAESVHRLKKRLPNAQITVDVPSELLMIPMDAVLIEQVLINLLENAVIHSYSKKPIECTVTFDRLFVYFHIRDFGIGIPEDKIDSLFDASTVLDEYVTDGRRGMGIGLSICKTIVIVHGGIIKAKNHSDGAEFVFTLPKEEYVYES